MHRAEISYPCRKCEDAGIFVSRNLSLLPIYLETEGEYPLFFHAYLHLRTSVLLRSPSIYLQPVPFLGTCQQLRRKSCNEGRQLVGLL